MDPAPPVGLVSFFIFFLQDYPAEKVSPALFGIFSQF